MNDTFMKEKPVLPLILSMAMPMVLSMLVNSLYNIIDSFFVAQISEEAMTALSLVYPVQNFINAVGIGFGVGINAVIAFYLGAGDNKKADQAATQGLVLAMIHGVVMTVCGITMMPAFLGMFTSSKTVIELGVHYSVIAFAFTLVIIVGVTFEKLFQAVGNMKTTMISLMCGCITNIVLDPILIFGYGPFPEMGIEGAALATGIGQDVYKRQGLWCRCYGTWKRAHKVRWTLALSRPKRSVRNVIESAPAFLICRTPVFPKWHPIPCIRPSYQINTGTLFSFHRREHQHIIITEHLHKL